MNTSKLIIAILIIVFAFTGCNLSGNSDNSYQPAELKNNYSTMEQSTGNNNLKLASTESEHLNASFENRLIIMKGTLRIETGDFADSESRLLEMTKKYSGFVTSSSSEINAAGSKSGSVTVRIPFGKFQDFVKEASSIGKVLSQDISGNDVTEEYIDLEARLKTQRELENRLLSLLNQKTGKLTEIIEVEQKLSSVRQIIESTEGRMKYLKEQSLFSTLEVRFIEPQMLQTASGGGFFYEIEQGFKKGLKGFTEILSGLIMLFVSFSHIIVIFIFSVIFLRRYFKRKKIISSEPVKEM